MSLIAKDEKFESDDSKRFTLRMDSKLFDSISVIAKSHRRSVAKEIECAVDEYIQRVTDEE